MIGRHSRTARAITAALTVAAIPAIAAVGCTSRPSAPAPPVHPSAPLAPIADYSSAVTVALHDHLRVWIEADMVRRWEEGPNSFRAAIARVSALASRPGVAGIKVADELGYRDGMTSPGKIRQFLSATVRALRAAVPGKQILVDMVVPQLGCIPGHQPGGSPEAACAAQAARAYPQLTLAAVDSYLRLKAIDVLDLSTGLLAESTYTAWATTSDAAQIAAWREVNRRGWPDLVRLQARKALAHPGSYPGSDGQAATDAHLYIDIPLAGGARAVDVWTWRQRYDGVLYRLMNPGMQANALWQQLLRRRRAGDVLFTHMSPHSIERGLIGDMAKIATVFTDVFLPAGTG